MAKNKTQVKKKVERDNPNGKKPTMAEVKETLLTQRDQGEKNIQALSLRLAQEKEYLLKVLGGIEVLEQIDG